MLYTFLLNSTKFHKIPIYNKDTYMLVHVHVSAKMCTFEKLRIGGGVKIHEVLFSINHVDVYNAYINDAILN